MIKRRQSKTCGRNNAQTRASLSATDSNSADMADHAPQPRATLQSAFATITQSIVADIAHAQHATRSSRMENQAASAGSAARQRTTVLPLRTSTVGRIAVGSSSQRGLTTRPSRGSREHPNAAHLSHLQEATSISHSTSSSGVYFTFGNSDNTR